MLEDVVAFHCKLLPIDGVLRRRVEVDLRKVELFAAEHRVRPRGGVGELKVVARVERREACVADSNG